jgi:hypothetical protein
VRAHRQVSHRQRRHLRSTSTQRSAPVGTQGHDERVRIGFAAAKGAGGVAAKDFAQRGVDQVPIRYVRTETNGIEKTPDRQVQEAIAEVFLQFRRLGSVRQVLLWYR